MLERVQIKNIPMNIKIHIRGNNKIFRGTGYKKRQMLLKDVHFIIGKKQKTIKFV